MLNEVKTFFNNIKRFRHLINEAVGENDIRKYIENHEWILLYYTGDEKVAKGVRTIRPYVLGTSKKDGGLVLRAWQDDTSNSWHFRNKPTRPESNPDMTTSKFHDYWTDKEGEKPGWRMFRLDKISHIHPTGRKFVDSSGNVMIPPGYREGGDENMANIIAYVSSKNEPDFDYTYDREEIVGEPEEISKSDWQSIARGNKNRRQINKNDVETLNRLVTKFHKRSKENFIVVIDDKNNFRLVTQNQINRARKKEGIDVPYIAIVGKLSQLYDKFVKEKFVTIDNRWFDEQKQKMERDIAYKEAEKERKMKQKQQIKEELPSIPFERKTFFKQ